MPSGECFLCRGRKTTLREGREKPRAAIATQGIRQARLTIASRAGVAVRRTTYFTITLPFASLKSPAYRLRESGACPSGIPRLTLLTFSPNMIV